MATQAIAACRTAFQWLKENNHDVAGLTGQDTRALRAIAHCWELYAAGDVHARIGAVGAVAGILPALQRKYWFLAKELIAHSLDWGDREPVWSQAMNVIGLPAADVLASSRGGAF